MPFRNVIIEVPTQKRHPYGQLTGIEEKPHITIQSTVKCNCRECASDITDRHYAAFDGPLSFSSAVLWKVCPS